MGLDPKTLLDVLNNSSARSWSTEVYCPVPDLVPTAPSSRNYDGGFKNELMVKVSCHQLKSLNQVRYLTGGVEKSNKAGH